MKNFKLISLSILFFLGNASIAQEILKNKEEALIKRKVFSIQVSYNLLDGNATRKTDKLIIKEDRVSTGFSDAQGFTPALCTFGFDSSMTPPIVKFTAESKSTNNGVLRWAGIIIGISIEGTAFWEKDGIMETAYNFNGIYKKME